MLCLSALFTNPQLSIVLNFFLCNCKEPVGRFQPIPRDCNDKGHDLGAVKQNNVIQQGAISMFNFHIFSLPYSYKKSVLCITNSTICELPRFLIFHLLVRTIKVSVITVGILHW